MLCAGGRRCTIAVVVSARAVPLVLCETLSQSDVLRVGRDCIWRLNARRLSRVYGKIGIAQIFYLLGIFCIVVRCVTYVVWENFAHSIT